MESTIHGDSYLPSDVIFEILSRSSLTSLGRFRQLSKACNSLTYESSFVNLHCQRSNILSGFFLKTYRRRYYSTFVSTEDSASGHQLSLDFLPANNVNIVASTKQGILVCIDDRARLYVPRYYVCKPSTKEWQVIPNPKTRYSTEGLGMLVLRSNPLHYKIVRLSTPKTQNSFDYRGLRCESYDSVTTVWKQLPQLVKLGYMEILHDTPPVASSGSLHWLTYYKNILAYHAEKEKYSLFSLPNVSDRYDCFQLIEYEGKIGFICMEILGESSMELWVMQNYEQKLWSMRQIINIEPVRRVDDFTYPLAMYNADTVLMYGIQGVNFFKFKNGNDVSRVELNYDISNPEVFPIRSDFQLCNLNNEYVKNRLRVKPRNM